MTGDGGFGMAGAGAPPPSPFPVKGEGTEGRGERAPRRIAMLSLHTSPLAPLGGRETGGMNVYVREVASRLGALGIAVDVFTRRSSAAEPEVRELGEGARLVQVVAGPKARIEKEEMVPF